MFSVQGSSDALATGGELLPGKPELKVGFILMNRFTLIPVAGFVDSLRFAADVSFSSRQIYCQWDWMSVDDKPATASCEMRIEPTRELINEEKYDYIVLAGGLLEETRDPPEYLLELLRQYYAHGIPIIGMCSASFVLGKAGLLRKKRCAVHFTIVDEFRERFPEANAVIDKSYIDDNGIITCPGGTAIDLAAGLIRSTVVKSERIKGWSTCWWMITTRRKRKMGRLKPTAWRSMFIKIQWCSNRSIL